MSRKGGGLKKQEEAKTPPWAKSVVASDEATSANSVFNPATTRVDPSTLAAVTTTLVVVPRALSIARRSLSSRPLHVSVFETVATARRKSKS